MVRRIQERADMEDVRNGEKGEVGCERGRAGKGERRPDEEKEDIRDGEKGEEGRERGKGDRRRAR